MRVEVLLMQESPEKRVPGFGWSELQAWLASWGWRFVAWRGEPDLRQVEPVVRSELALAGGQA